MISVELDFETKSECDLKLCGAERYAEDPTTEILCLIYKVNDEWFEWAPGDDEARLCALADNPEIYFVAHNAAFEQAIWRNIMFVQYGFPMIPISRWRCTMAACAWKGMPLALDKAGRALKLPMQKDKEGNTLTLSMSKPIRSSKASRANGTVGQLPELTPAIRRRIMDYCKQDVVVEDGVKGRVGLLGKAEQTVWELDQTINQRGVRLDLEFVAAAQAVVDKASGPLRQEFQDLTGLDKVGSPKLLDWCLANGTILDNLQKKTLAKLLDVEEDDGSPDAGYESLADDDDDDVELSGMGGRFAALPWQVRRVLEIRQMLGGAAIKKLKRMQACCGYDGRARGLLQYHAAHSGRWGGRLLQPQNFPRDTIKGCDPEQAVQAILSGDPRVVEHDLGLRALDAVARSLRHALVAEPGKVFMVGDYAQIEARIVLALAGQHDKTALIAAGQSPYLDFGAIMFGREISKDNNAEYIPSKAGVLGCGFQCGRENFNIKFLGGADIDTAELVVDTYRKEWAPKVPPLWYELGKMSLRAVERGQMTEAYGIVFEPAGEWLRARLPSGWQSLWYYAPSLGTSRFDNLCWTSMQSKQGKWIKVDMYGGLETENVVQALARGLLVSAMRRLEAAGMPVVLTCHDEIVVEVDEGLTDKARFASLMVEPTSWSKKMGVPIAVETWTGTRYRK